MKKIATLLCSLCFLPLLLLAPLETFADDDSLSIIPVADSDKVNEAIQKVGSDAWNVVDNYNYQASQLTCEQQIASGIWDWWTILCYAVDLVSFLSQVGIAIGALMIVYAWYIYATAVFRWGNASAGKTAVTRAILGVIVIVFSYAIVRIITRAFLT